MVVRVLSAGAVAAASGAARLCATSSAAGAAARPSGAGARSGSKLWPANTAGWRVGETGGEVGPRRAPRRLSRDRCAGGRPARGGGVGHGGAAGIARRRRRARVPASEREVKALAERNFVRLRVAIHGVVSPCFPFTANHEGPFGGKRRTASEEAARRNGAIQREDRDSPSVAGLSDNLPRPPAPRASPSPPPSHRAWLQAGERGPVGASRLQGVDPGVDPRAKRRPGGRRISLVHAMGRVGLEPTTDGL